MTEPTLEAARDIVSLVHAQKAQRNALLDALNTTTPADEHAQVARIFHTISRETDATVTEPLLRAHPSLAVAPD